jgi:hypothetical protein
VLRVCSFVCLLALAMFASVVRSAPVPPSHPPSDAHMTCHNEMAALGQQARAESPRLLSGH